MSVAPTRDPTYDKFFPENNTIQMMIRWRREDVTTNLVLLGFDLQMDDGLGNDDQFKPIFDSGNNPLGESYLVSGLTPSWTYRFMVRARDINRLGPNSPQGSFVACIVPGEMAAPNLTAVDATTFSLAWKQPEHTGGCAITNYAVLLS